MNDNIFKTRIDKIILDLGNLITEIIELRELGERLLVDQKKLQMVVNFAYDWEYWQNENGDYLYVSPSVESLTGYTVDDFQQNKKILEKIIDPVDWDKWEQHSHTMLSNNRVEPLEFRIKTKSGETKWIHHVCRTVYDSNGKNCGVRGTNRDITSHKELQEEVKKLRESNGSSQMK